MQLTIRIRERQLYGIDVNGANPNKILKIQHILMKYILPLIYRDFENFNSAIKYQGLVITIQIKFISEIIKLQSCLS